MTTSVTDSVTTSVPASPRALCNRTWKGALAAASLTTACSAPPSVPAQPTWTDVAPILRAECGSCHGASAKTNGQGLRLDLYDFASDVCGAATLALDPGLILAGSPVAAAGLKTSLVPQAGATWPLMPPQPSPELPTWERDTLLRWAAQPARGPGPSDNRAPTVDVSQFPASAKGQLTFTAIIGDPDGDAVMGVVQIGEQAFLMDRAGSFAVHFDVASLPVGPARVSAVVCDGWSRRDVDLGPVQIAR